MIEKNFYIRVCFRIAKLKPKVSAGFRKYCVLRGDFPQKNKKEYFCGVCLKLENRDKVCDSLIYAWEKVVYETVR